MKSSIKRLFALFTMASAGMLASACGATDAEPTTVTTAEVPDPNAGGGVAWDSIVSAAKDEGEVVLYVVYPGLEERLTNGFKAAYPDIKLTIVRQPTAELVARLDQEKATGAPGADVAALLSPSWYTDNQQYLVSSDGPMYKQYWQGSAMDTNNGIAPTWLANTVGLIVNNALVDELGADPVKRPADIFQKELEGAIGYVPPGSVSNAAVESWYFMMKGFGADSESKLRALKPDRFESSAPLGDAVTSGEIAVGIYSNPSLVAAAQKAGAPVSLVPFEPSVVSVIKSGIIKTAHHPNAAQVLQNWILSPAGQHAISAPGDGILSTLPPGTFGDLIPDDHSLAEGSSVIDSITDEAQRSWYTDAFAPALGL